MVWFDGYRVINRSSVVADRPQTALAIGGAVPRPIYRKRSGAGLIDVLDPWPV